MASRLSVDEVDDIFFCPGNIVSERPDPGKVCSPACSAIDGPIPVIVGKFKPQMLQDRRLTDIEAQ